jgi:glycosyltransferase involved in cell wall biosynthesis
MFLLSICIPTYNRKKNLSLLLESIKPSPYIEVVVCDDGSTDNTKELIQIYRDKLNIKYIYQKNSGVSASILKAYIHATGKYVIKMDSDDYFLEGGLEFILNSIKNNEEVKAFIFGIHAVKNKQNLAILPPSVSTNFIAIRADYKIKGDLKEVVLRTIVIKYMYKVPKKIKRIPPGLLWFKIAENYNCLSFNHAVAVKTYLEDGISSHIHYLKIIYPKYMVELYEILSSSKVYKSIIFRWLSRLLWARYSFHNYSMKVDCWWHLIVWIPAKIIFFIDRATILKYKFGKLFEKN